MPMPVAKNSFGIKSALSLGTLFLAGLSLAVAADTPSKNGAVPDPKPERGWVYQHVEARDIPWSIHVVKMAIGHKDLQVDSMMGFGTTLGVGVVSQQARAVPSDWGKPIAAINGDFFNGSRNYPGDPDGMQISHGEIVSGPNPSRICFWIDDKGVPHRSQVSAEFKVTWPDKTTTRIGMNEEREIDAAVLYTKAIGSSTRTYGGQDIVLEQNGSDPWLPLQVSKTYNARVRSIKVNGNATLESNAVVLSLGPRLSAKPVIKEGMVLQISTTTKPELPGAFAAVGGGPTLLEMGKIRDWPNVQGADTRHPRTAVGWNKDYLFFVEVDGRQRSLSIGMTLRELAQYLKMLGCDEAVNFDGGGSSTLWVLGNVMNSPCQGGERAAANSLVLIQKSQPLQKPQPPK
jgi:large repetitive protein